mgnify:FL=1
MWDRLPTLVGQIANNDVTNHQRYWDRLPTVFIIPYQDNN